MESALEHKKFSTIAQMDMESLYGWITAEINFWTAIQQKINQALNNPVNSTEKPSKKTADFISAYIRQLSAIRSNETTEDPTPALLKLIYGAKLPNHYEPAAKTIESNAYSGAKLESMLFAYSISLDAQLEAYAETYHQRSEALAIQADKKINELLKKEEDATSERIKKHLAVLGTAEKDIDKKLKEAVTDIEKAVSAGTEAVNLSEPVKYWNERRIFHKANARNYGRYALFSAIAFLLIIFTIFSLELTAGRIITLGPINLPIPQHNFGIALLAIITTGGVWGIRVLLKLMMTNLALETESLERATMIKTYVAMTATNGTPKDENQTLFYTTLFRPSQSSFTEDGTAPEFSRVLEIIMKK
nr:DUF6161 domain-containing protein [Pseudomonas sp.]